MGEEEQEEAGVAEVVVGVLAVVLGVEAVDAGVTAVASEEVAVVEASGALQGVGGVGVAASRHLLLCCPSRCTHQYGCLLCLLSFPLYLGNSEVYTPMVFNV